MIELIHIGATKGHPKQRQIYIIICFHTTNSTIFFLFISLQQNHNAKTAKKISFSGLFPLEQKPGFSAASDRPNRQPPISVLFHRRATPPAIKAK
ncbi:MAG: hypothetical protein ACLUFW_10900 [Alistipes sp.]